MEFFTLVNKMIVFLALMLIGYVCARRGIADAVFTKTVSRLVINVYMSATILKSVFDLQISIGLRELGGVVLTMALMMVFCFALGFLATKLLRIDREHAPIFELLCSLSNTVFVGLPVADALFGAQAVFYVSMSNIPFNLILYTYGVWLLKSGKQSGRMRLRDMLSVPLVVTLIAVLIVIVKPPVPTVLRELANTMAGATTPLSMLVIGSSLGTVSLLDAFRNKRLYAASFIRLILAPVLVALLFRPFVGDPVLLVTCVILAACPGAVMITVLSIQYGRDYVFSSEGVLHSTFLSMFTIPALLYFLF